MSDTSFPTILKVFKYLDKSLDARLRKFYMRCGRYKMIAETDDCFYFQEVERDKAR